MKYLPTNSETCDDGLGEHRTEKAFSSRILGEIKRAFGLSRTNLNKLVYLQNSIRKRVQIFWLTFEKKIK